MVFPLFSTHRAVLCHALAFLISACFMAVTNAQDIGRLLRSTKIVREMDEKQLVELVPQQSGLQYVGCPNCDAGRQERQLTWTIERPDEVKCQFCGHRFPSEKYPMQGAVVVSNPRGESTRFDYWEDENGYRYFFGARRDDEVRKYLASQALKLAQLFAATGETAYARRAALILDRFAQVFPGWCYHYDYPFRQKEIYDGDVAPEDFRAGFRTARWNWWAYHDIPTDLLETFRLIRKSGALEELSKEKGTEIAHRIEHDLLRNAGEQVIANRDDCSNMSPSVWRSLVKLGRVIDEPRYTHEVVRRFRRLMNSKFFYDGFWYEGAPSYAMQTIGSLERVLRELNGYSDPPGYVDSSDGTRFDDLNLAKDFPLLNKAQAIVERMRLPNGRLVPVHDTWAYTRQGEPVLSAKSYMLPALGHACLLGGDNLDRSEFHFSWSGGYGHQHLDVLSLLLFSHGHESLSDLGYTHTAYRSWALATASHNTVVIDGKSQSRGSLDSPTDGSLRLADLTNPHVRVVSSDGVRAYPDLAETYRRTLIVVEVDEQRRYAVDLFEVDGGSTHDYFLHGDADEPTQLICDLNFDELPSLLPTGFQWTPTKNEGQAGRASEDHYAFGFLRDLRATDLQHNATVAVDFQMDSQPQVGLRVHLCPEPNSQLVLGRNPSIRKAEEDDAKLDEYHRPFLMLRHHSEGGPSSFVSVLEPFGTKPSVTSVKRIDQDDDAIVLQIEVDDRTDTIVFNARDQQSLEIDSLNFNKAMFQGEVGMLRTSQEKIERAYVIGEGGWQASDFELTSVSPQNSSLIGTELDSLIVTGVDILPPSQGDIVRLITADGWVYPYTVTSTSSGSEDGALRLNVAEGPGIDLDATEQHLRLTSFPQREHRGKVEVQWSPSRCWSPELAGNPR